MDSRVVTVLMAAFVWAQEAPEPKLKTRDEVAQPALPTEAAPKDLWVLSAGTKIPIQLRQPVSTKSAQPGDPIYAQTTFPIVADGDIVIPAGTWVQGKVDSVKRAGRLKGTAELQFHLTNLIYPNGYTLDIAAAIDNVPGEEPTSVKEPGTVKRDSEKGKDLERIGTGASQGGQIGGIAGAAAGRSIRSVGIGGVTGIAAGTLIALLTRGSDVTFEAGKAVEISLSHPMAIERMKALRAPAGVPAQ
jgi:hypothetical protein